MYEKNELIDSLMDDREWHKYGVLLKVNQMLSHPFFLSEIFSDNPTKGEGRLGSVVFSLVSQYVKEWVLKDQKNLAKNVNLLTSEPLSVAKFSEVLDILYDNKHFDCPEILIPVSNAKMEFKRFGDSLGFKLFSNNGRSKEEHVDGAKILEALCGLNGARSGAGFYLKKFVHSFEFTIPLSKKRGEKNESIIDFSEVRNNLVGSCPFVEWLQIPEFSANITGEAYLAPNHLYRALVGNCKKGSVPVTAKLLHYEKPQGQDSVQWRKGNIAQLHGPGWYRFEAGEDLSLSLRIECPFESSYFLKVMAPEIKVGQIQDDLKLAAASIYLQLCAMVANI